MSYTTLIKTHTVMKPHHPDWCPPERSGGQQKGYPLVTAGDAHREVPCMVPNYLIAGLPFRILLLCLNGCDGKKNERSPGKSVARTIRCVSFRCAIRITYFFPAHTGGLFSSEILHRWFRKCHDNAVAESFFQLLKRERIKKKIYGTREEARSDIFDYIEMFYNSKRRHGSNNQMSPTEYENQYYQRLGSV